MKRLLLVLLLIYVASVAHRLSLSAELPYYLPADGTGFFWTEDALQYRYAKMVAHGIEIPSHDFQLQAPEGVEPFKAFTIAMELVAGKIYRLLGLELPFHTYVIYFVSLFSSLSIFPVGVLAAVFWNSRLAGALAAFLYAFSIPAFDRVVGSFIREGFALPLLFFGICCFYSALQQFSPRRGGILALAAGVFFGLGLASWHLARFYLAQFSLLLFLLGLFGGDDPARVRRVVGLFLLPVIGMACAIPALVENATLLSPGVTLGIAAFAATFLKKRTAFLTRVLTGGLLLAVALLVGASAATGGQYGHVFATIKAMIIHLGSKPADPTSLDMMTRIMWVEAFTSPSFELFVSTFLWLALPLALAIPPLWRLRIKAPVGFQWLILGLLLVTTLEYLVMRRIGSFAIFFFAVVAGGAVVQVLRREGWGRWGLALLLLVTGAGQCYSAQTYLRGNPIQDAIRSLPWSAEDSGARFLNWQVSNTNLLRWVKANVDRDTSILATMGLSGTVIAYTGRPVVLHSKFETNSIRTKYEEFLQSLYADEETFYRFCSKYRVGYFIYEPFLALETDPDSTRYIADQLSLPASSAVFQMQFFPERLGHLELVFQNPTYRIFKVVGRTMTENRNEPYQPVYDPQLYATQWPDSSRFDGFVEQMNEALTKAVVDLQTVAGQKQAGRFREAAVLADQLRQQWPNLPYLNGLTCELNMLRGDLQAAMNACRVEANLTPYSPDTHYLLSDLLSRLGRPMLAQRERDTALELERTMFER